MQVIVEISPIVVVLNMAICMISITNTVDPIKNMSRYTDGSVAQGWVKEGAWHGVYRLRMITIIIINRP